MNVSKNSVKRIKSLHQKKKRFQENIYLVEGIKLVEEYFKSCPNKILELVVDENILAQLPREISSFEHLKLSDTATLKSLSQQATSSGIIALIQLEKTPIEPNEILLYLDQINDPGNLGTIIRLADWYGLKQIFISPNTVDHTNFKVIQSAMGSSARVGIHLLSFDEMKSQFSEHQFIGASMEGKNIYEHALPKPSVLVMGSESHGISDEIRKQLDYVCAIPAFGPTESLNVGVATAIFLHELKRP